MRPEERVEFGRTASHSHAEAARFSRRTFVKATAAAALIVLCRVSGGTGYQAPE